MPLTADWSFTNHADYPRICATRMSHKSKQYLTNPRPRLFYQSWGSNTLILHLQQFSCPLASHPVTKEVLVSCPLYRARDVFCSGNIWGLCCIGCWQDYGELWHIYPSSFPVHPGLEGCEPGVSKDCLVISQVWEVEPLVCSLCSCLEL